LLETTVSNLQRNETSDRIAQASILTFWRMVLSEI